MKQQANEPHLSPEKHFLAMNKLDLSYDYTSASVKSHYYWYLLLKKGVHLKHFVPSLVEIGPVILDKKVPNISLLKMAWPLI